MNSDAILDLTPAKNFICLPDKIITRMGDSIIVFTDWVTYQSVLQVMRLGVVAHEWRKPVDKFYARWSKVI